MASALMDGGVSISFDKKRKRWVVDTLIPVPQRMYYKKEEAARDFFHGCMADADEWRTTQSASGCLSRSGSSMSSLVSMPGSAGESMSGSPSGSGSVSASASRSESGSDI